MKIKLQFIINSLFIVTCNNMVVFTSEINNSCINIYNSTLSNSEISTSSKEIEMSKYNEYSDNINNNCKKLSYIPINIVDCEHFRDMIQEIHDFNMYKRYTFEKIVCGVNNNNINSDVYKSRFYLDNKAQNKCFISNSAFALKLADELTNNTIQLQKYRSKYYAINCYKTLMHLMYIIGKSQDTKNGFTMDIGTTKINMTGQKHITSYKKQEDALYNYSDKFLPFYNYFLNEIYPRMFEEPIYTSVLFKLGEVLKRKSDEIVYINTSLLPQLQHLIKTANKVKTHIVLLNKRIDYFKMYLSIIKQTILNSNIDNTVINILDELSNDIDNNKYKFDIDLVKCEKLVSSIKSQFSNINKEQWSYAYNLSKEIPILAIMINMSKSIIIDNNFSFSNNLDYLIKLIEAYKWGNDDNYIKEINSILEELKHFNYLD